MADNNIQKGVDAIRDNDLKVNLENIRADISKLRTDLSELSKGVKETGKGYAKATTDKIIESIGNELDKLGEDKEKVIGKVRDELENIQDMSKETIDSVEDKIQENPFKSILIAFIVGIFLGKVFDGK